MRRAAAAALFLIALSYLGALAQISNTGGVNDTGNCGVNTGTCQTFFYFSTSGSDTNNCLSKANPCQTIGHLNSLTLPANAVILFNGGQTFGGGTTGLVLTTTVTPGPITIGSYGTGQATISTGNSAACVTATNVPAPQISNIVCTGGGNATNTTAGISIVNSQGNTKLAGPVISGVTLSGYGGNCINIQGTSGTSGFSGGGVFNSTLHDCTGEVNSAGITACISVGAATPGSYSMVALTFSGNVIYNCTGIASSSGIAGTGMIIAECLNCVATLNIIHDCGINSTTDPGPGGIQTLDVSGFVASYNEVYNITHGTGGKDGNGIQFSAGTINSIAHHNWTHDNISLGLHGANLALGYPGNVWGNNTFAFNLSQNNGTGEISFYFSQASTAPVYVYNNTLVGTTGGYAIGDAGSGDTAAWSATIANNILIGTNGGKIISFANPQSANLYGNDYFTYNGAATTFTWNGTTYTSFASWQTATGQEKISGSNVGLTSNPSIYVPGGGFTNAGYVPANLMAYNLQSGSPMVGAGLSLAQFGIVPLTTDYYGVAVNPAALPVGAANGDFTSFVASCTAATNYLARVSSFTKVDNVNYNSLLCGQNSDGDLALIDTEYVLAAPNHAAAILNLVSTSFGLTEHGTCTFVARSGITGDHSTCYEDTGFISSTAGGNFTLNAASMFIYDLTSRATQVWTAIGAQNTAATAETSITPYSFFGDVNNENGVGGGLVTPQGVTLVQRTTSARMDAYRNGPTSFGHDTTASVALIDKSFTILAENISGTIGGFSGDTISAAGFGGIVSVSHIPQRLNSFMMAYGINVY